MATREDIVKLYVGYFNRAPDPEGLNYWLDEIADGTMTLAEIAQSFSVQDEALDLYPYLSFPNIVSPEAFVTQVYLNLFNREPDAEGLAYWVGELESGKPVGEAIIDIMSGAQDSEAGNDLTTLNNKVEAADNFTVAFATAGLTYFTTDSDGNMTPIAESEAAARDVIADVTDDPESVDEANDKTTDFISGGETITGGSVFFLSSITGFNPVTGEIVEYDNLVGTSGDDTFYAEPGDLNTGDRVNGVNGMDELIVVEDQDQGFDEISPVTSGVEHIVITNQERDDDNDGDNNIDDVDVYLDGGRMDGVIRWEDYDSRADLVIEDARDSSPEDGTFTADITVAMVSTDPGNVDFAIYFDDPVNTSARDDSIFIEVIDQNNSDVHDPGQINGNTEGNLTDARLVQFSFLYNEERVDIILPNPFDPADADLFVPNGDLPFHVGPNASYNDLVTVIDWAMNDEASPYVGEDWFGDITVELSDNEFSENIGDDNDSADTEQLVFGLQIELNSLSGAELGDAGAGDIIVESTTDPADTAQSITAAPAIIEDCIRIDVVLDDVGKSSAGGDLVIGAMSTGTQGNDPSKSDSVGIQCFDIYVDRESNLQTINSTNNSLEEVHIMSRDNDTARGDSNDIAGRDELQSGDLIVRGGTVTRDYGYRYSWQSWIDENNNNPFPGAEPQHDLFGFTDVRKIGASDLNGSVDLTATLTDSIVAKYLDLQDTDQDQKDDQVLFDYDLTSNDDEFLLLMSAKALTDAGTGSREDFDLDISGGAGSDWITTNVGQAIKILDEQGQDWFLMTDGDEDFSSGGASDEDNDGVPDWYENHSGQDTSTLSVNGNSGADYIWTFGYGDYRVDAGTGDDVIYSDNSGVAYLTSFFGPVDINEYIDRPVTAQSEVADNIRGDHTQIDYAINGVWTFNDDNDGEDAGSSGDVSDIQGATNDVIEEARSDADLRDWFVTLSFSTEGNGTAYAIQEEVSLTIGSGDVIDDAIMNQAIKDIIDGSTLDHVLEYQDGPGQSLLVWSRIDGDFTIDDLNVELVERDDDGDDVTVNTFFNDTARDFEQFGSQSTALTSSDLIGNAGDDVIVMSSSNAHFDAGTASPLEMNAEQTIFLGDDFGCDYVYHFDIDSGLGPTDDIMRITAFGSDGDWDTLTRDAIGGDDSIDLWDGAPGTLAEIEDLYGAALGAGEQAIAVIYDDDVAANDNVGDFYYVDGLAGSAADLTYIGSIKLIGSDWDLLDEDNFFGVA